MDQRPVLVMGDSHSLFFRGHDTIFPAPFTHPGIDILHLSAASAWRLSTPGDKFQWLMEKAFHSKKYAAIVFTVGYIDCRSHIVKCAARNARSVEQQADAIAEKFLNSVQKAKAYGTSEAVFLCPPASVSLDFHRGWQIEGTQAERNKATVAFANRIKADSSVGFIDTLDYSMRPDGTTVDDAFFDKVHMRATHLPTVISRLRSELNRLGVKWSETGGGDFKLACHPREVERAKIKHRIAALAGSAERHPPQ
jgi:hypothetical protein